MAALTLMCRRLLGKKVSHKHLQSVFLAPFIESLPCSPLCPCREFLWFLRQAVRDVRLFNVLMLFVIFFSFFPSSKLIYVHFSGIGVAPGECPLLLLFYLL